MRFMPSWTDSGPKPNPRKSTRAGLALIGALLVLSGAPQADTLPREWAAGLPEPSEYQNTENSTQGFCPLGVCQPRRRDSLYAGGAFGLTALASAYIGRRRRQKPSSDDPKASRP